MFLDVSLPRSCVLCGYPLPPRRDAHPWPLCSDCSVMLRPWAGERCESCGLPLISEHGRCMRCRGIERAFDSAYPLFSYAGAARELISAYKKSRRRSLAPFFADIFAKTIEEKWPDRIIVPVPPRPGKARASGWDQVEEIARSSSGEVFEWRGSWSVGVRRSRRASGAGNGESTRREPMRSNQGRHRPSGPPRRRRHHHLRHPGRLREGVEGRRRALGGGPDVRRGLTMSAKGKHHGEACARSLARRAY